MKSVGCNSLGGSSPSPSVMNNDLYGRYCFVPFILKMKKNGSTNQEIADFFDCSVSTVKYAIANSPETKPQLPIVDKQLGKVDYEYLRVSSVHKCQEIFTKRGWQTGESDPKCKFDVFAYKDKKVKRIQVRSSTKLSKRGWPSFKTSRLRFNTKECSRVQFDDDDFDYWFFYYTNGDSWLIPKADISHSSVVSMEGFDKYSVQ